MKLTGIAREDLEAKGLVLPNKLELECRGIAIPDIYVDRIGRKNVDTGEFESFFKVDNKNGNTVEFDRFRENVTLLEKEHTVFSRETLEEKNVIDYYVPYDIQESSKNKAMEEWQWSYCQCDRSNCEKIREEIRQDG